MLHNWILDAMTQDLRKRFQYSLHSEFWNFVNFVFLFLKIKITFDTPGTFNKHTIMSSKYVGSSNVCRLRIIRRNKVSIPCTTGDQKLLPIILASCPAVTQFKYSPKFRSHVGSVSKGSVFFEFKFSTNMCTGLVGLSSWKSTNAFAMLLKYLRRCDSVRT